jgi:hypothetical protein
MGERIKPIEFTSRAIKDLQKVKSFNLKLYGKPKTEAIINSIFQRIEALSMKPLKISGGNIENL